MKYQWKPISVSLTPLVVIIAITTNIGKWKTLYCGKAAYRCWMSYWLTTEDSNFAMWELGLGAMTVVSIAITMHVTASQCDQTQSKTNSEWAIRAGSMFLMFSWQWYRCECCQISSQRIFTNGWTSYKTTPETLTNSHHSLGMRPRQDYTHSVMLKRLC